jgi:hypothetical protein
VGPVPDPLLLRKSGSAGNQTRDLWTASFNKITIIDSNVITEMAIAAVIRISDNGHVIAKLMFLVLWKIAFTD